MTSCPFKVSDKVICVDASPGCTTHLVTLALGQVYVIDGVWVSKNPRDIGAIAISVVGIHLGWQPSGLALGFRWQRFRKLDEVQAENRARLCEGRKSEP